MQRTCIMGITISSISSDISVPNQITLYFTVTAGDPSLVAGILFALDPSSSGTDDLISVGQSYTTVTSIYSPTNGINTADAGATFVRWAWTPSASSMDFSIVLSDPTYYDIPTNLMIYVELTGGPPTAYGQLSVPLIVPATTIAPTTTPAPTTTASAYDPFSNSVSQISLQGIPLAGNCGTAAKIESDTQSLLLGCIVCPAEINTSAYTTGSLLCGTVSSKMKCNPMGAFCYNQKIDNRCDNAVDQEFKHFDVALYSEFDTVSLLTIYLQSIAMDSVNHGILDPETIALVLNLLATDGINTYVMNLLEGLFASLGVPIDRTDPGGDCMIDHQRLKLILLTKLRIIHKLQMQINGNALNAKEATSQVNHRVNIAWDFCSNPRARPCCDRKSKK